MAVAKWHPAMAAVAAPHLDRSVDFERSQKEAVADVLDQIIEIIGFEAGPPYDAPLFKSLVSVPRLLDYIRAMAARANE